MLFFPNCLQYKDPHSITTLMRMEWALKNCLNVNLFDYNLFFCISNIIFSPPNLIFFAQENCISFDTKVGIHKIWAHNKCGFYTPSKKISQIKYQKLKSYKIARNSLQSKWVFLKFQGLNWKVTWIKAMICFWDVRARIFNKEPHRSVISHIHWAL